IDMLAIRLINRRLESRARAGASFLGAGADLTDLSRSANLTMVQVMPIGEDWVTALKDVRATIADAMAHPPTQAEIDREIAEIESEMKQQVATARVQTGASLAAQLIMAVDINETVTTPQAS